MLTAGAEVSMFNTVTVIPAEVVRLPAASRAMAVSVCVPLGTSAVFQETLNTGGENTATAWPS